MTMNLFRIHAYEVTPQRLAVTETPPRGGAFAPDASLIDALDDYLKKSKLQSQATVDLRRGTSANGNPAPTHQLRGYVVNYCFGAPSSAKSAALAMARRLGNAMDNRSVFTLLMLAAYKTDNMRRLVMWAFPKDEPFHFSVQGERAKIKILHDAFSRSSSLKKAALFEGTNSLTSFWSCHVIDKQAESAFGTGAEYWVDLFLDSRPSLSGKAGTRLLARCLKRTHEALVDETDKDQLSNSIVGVRASQRSQWSLNRFASEYLTGNVKHVFLENAPPESRSATFAFSKEEFDQKIKFRVFRLQDNVMVAAPFGTIGQSVKIEDGAERRLKCEGIVVSEKVRAQHVG
jgi:hypothetical protein